MTNNAAPEVDVQQQLKDLTAKVLALELKVKDNENRRESCDRCRPASEQASLSPAADVVAGTPAL